MIYMLIRHERNLSGYVRLFFFLKAWLALCRTELVEQEIWYFAAPERAVAAERHRTLASVVSFVEAWVALFLIVANIVNLKKVGWWSVEASTQGRVEHSRRPSCASGDGGAPQAWVTPLPDAHAPARSFGRTVTSNTSFWFYHMLCAGKMKRRSFWNQFSQKFLTTRGFWLAIPFYLCKFQRKWS